MKQTRSGRVIGSVLVLALILIAGAGCGRGPSKEDALAEIEENATYLNDYQGDISFQVTAEEQSFSGEGKIFGQKPNKNYNEITIKTGEVEVKATTISNGSIAWALQKIGQDVQQLSKANTEKFLVRAEKALGAKIPRNDIRKPFSNLDREKLEYLGKKKLDGVKTYGFRGKPLINRPDQWSVVPAQIELWIGAEDAMVRKLILLGRAGEELMVALFTNVEINPGVSSSKFEYTPPYNVQVIDITEQVAQAIIAANQ